jgi:hypothetical protein
MHQVLYFNLPGQCIAIALAVMFFVHDLRSGGVRWGSFAVLAYCLGFVALTGYLTYADEFKVNIGESYAPHIYSLVANFGAPLLLPIPMLLWAISRPEPDSTGKQPNKVN